MKTHTRKGKASGYMGQTRRSVKTDYRRTASPDHKNTFHRARIVLTFLWHGKVWSKAWSFRFLITDFGAAHLTERTKMNTLAPHGLAVLPKAITSNPFLFLGYTSKRQSKSFSWYHYSWFLAAAWRGRARAGTLSIWLFFLISLDPFCFHITQKFQLSQRQVRVFLKTLW